jgi:hypothetical protein
MTARLASLASATVVACGASPAAPVAPGNVEPPAAATGVRAIDWRNAAYELTLLEGEGPTTFTLTDGRWGDPAVEEVRLDDVVFGDVTGDGVEEAAVLSTYQAPGYEFDRVDVYGADGVAPRWLGVVRGGDPGEDELSGLQIDGGALRVLRAGLDEGSWETWRWDGAYFELAPR